MFFKYDIALKVSTIVDRNSCSAKGFSLEAMAEHHYPFHNFKLLTTTPPQAMEYVLFFFDLGEFAVVFAENSLGWAVQGLHREKTANCFVSSDGAICKASRISVSRHFAPPGLTFLRLLQW